MSNSFEEICSKILLLDKNQFHDQTKKSDVEQWDSMTHLMLISDLEQEYDLIFSDDEVTGIQSIGDIKKALGNHGITIF